MTPPQCELFGTESARGRAGRIFLTVVICAHFTLQYLSLNPFLPLAAYAAGSVPRPYQTRILPMLLMRAVDHVSFVERIGNRMPLPAPGPDLLVLAVLAFVGMLVAIAASQATIQRLTGDRSVARWFPLLLPVMGYFVYCAPWGLHYTAPYDMPGMAFCAMSVWAVVSGRLWVFYPVFLLATLNRETAATLLVFLAAWESWAPAGGAAQGGWRWRWPGKAVLAHLAVLGVAWGAIRWAIAHHYRNSPSDAGTLSQRLVANLWFVVEPQQWPVLLSVGAFTLPLLWMGRRWLRGDRYAAAMTVTLVCWFAGLMAAAVLVEIRVFGEWSPLLVPALALIVSRGFRPADPAQEAQQPAL